LEPLPTLLGIETPAPRPPIGLDHTRTQQVVLEEVDVLPGFWIDPLAHDFFLH
jgi:hypothetical protein